MNTLTEKKLPEFEKVVYVAYGCGCVRSFLARQITGPAQRCPAHGDLQVSFIESYRQKAVAA